MLTVSPRGQCFDSCFTDEESELTGIRLSFLLKEPLATVSCQVSNCTGRLRGFFNIVKDVYFTKERTESQKAAISLLRSTPTSASLGLDLTSGP